MDVLVHGGAGSKPDNPDRCQKRLGDAASAGAAETDPIAAAVAAVRVLEAAPQFNAGRGSALQSDGQARTDAGLMTAEHTGAACSMAGVQHAIDVARVVATKTPHVLVAGNNAVELAEAFGVETDCDLTTTRTRERWAEANPPAEPPSERLQWVRDQFGGSDTVGAVTTDGERVVAATSTGGRWYALAGRVGDVPQVGAGFYATDAVAVSTTGAGEAIARFGLARRVVDAVEDGDDPQTAADRVLRGFASETGEHAGCIVITRAGQVGTGTNAHMQTARSHSDRA
jgi:isoaspartyl peptidase/L-asparaginase-like protein (Ntn-hydrolase superfamily)